jgi:hypothetical protein
MAMLFVASLCVSFFQSLEAGVSDMKSSCHTTLEVHGHEDAIGVELVVAKGAAGPKSCTLIKFVRWRKRAGWPGFQAQSFVATLDGFADDVIQNGSTGTLTSLDRWGSHGFDLAMFKGQFHEGTTAQKLIALSS